MQTISNFLYFHGYGIYIWPAYLSVFLYMGIQAFLPWRRWQAYRRRLNTHE